jgi:hypothetical protein
MNNKIVLIILLSISFLHGDGSKSTLVEMHLGLSPTSSFQYGSEVIGANRDYTFGISVPIIREKRLRLGIDITQIVWSSYRFYKFEKELLYENQKVGNSNELQRHRLIGLAPHISWTLNKDGHFWDKTTFIGGIHFGHPDTPNDMWYKKWGRITDRVTINPFVRFTRPIIAKYLWILGTVQMELIPYFGFNSSLFIEAKFSLF